MKNPRNIFEDDLSARTRTGKRWQVVFLVATILAIISLTLLLINIVNSVFGYVVLDTKVDPATLMVDDVPLVDQNSAQLVQLLKSNLSSGAFNKLENEKSFTQRNRAEIYQLVEERILKVEVLESWSLLDSIFKQEEVKTEYQILLETHPRATLKFISWLTRQRLVRPDRKSVV